jgi:hypothetical protein
MRASHVFAGVPVADYEGSRAWYERLLGRPPDLVPHPAEAAWRLSDSGWIYVVEDAERAGRALVTVLVEDLDAITRDDLVTGPIETVPGKFRRVVVTDVEGNRISFGESLAP